MRYMDHHLDRDYIEGKVRLIITHQLHRSIERYE
jgi:hypothetical protein